MSLETTDGTDGNTTSAKTENAPLMSSTTAQANTTVTLCFRHWCQLGWLQIDLTLTSDMYMQ
jgi:hypothetical protein